MNPYYDERSAHEMNNYAESYQNNYPPQYYQYPQNYQVQPSFVNLNQPRGNQTPFHQNMMQPTYVNFNPDLNNENYCPICVRVTPTRINYKIGATVWMSFILLIFIGLILCSWIPFLIK